MKEFFDGIQAAKIEYLQQTASGRKMLKEGLTKELTRIMNLTPEQAEKEDQELRRQARKRNIRIQFWCWIGLAFIFLLILQAFGVI